MQPSTVGAVAGDPVSAGWRAAGRPGHSDPVQGICARCGLQTECVPLEQVVSRSFTRLDEWIRPDQPGLCPACAWSYRTKNLRLRPCRVTRSPDSLAALTLVQLRRHLQHPLGADEALTVPTRPGRKHLLPHSRWGTVTLDDAPLTWSPGDADRLTVLRRLRHAGAPTASFTEPAPPWRILTGQTWPVRRTLLAQWDQLAPWRAAPLWLTLALIATKET